MNPKEPVRRFLAAVLLASFIAAACGQPASPPQEMPTSTTAPTATATPLLTPTSTVTATPLPAPTSTATLTPPPRPFVVNGLHVLYRERWEYIDSETGKTVGYWDQSRNQYVHLANYLKAEWAELFAPLDPRRVEEAIDAALAKGEVKLALPGICDAKEVKASGVYVHVAIRGLSSTEIIAPVGGPITLMPLQSGHKAVEVEHNGYTFSFLVPATAVVKAKEVQAGDLLLTLTPGAELPEGWITGKGWQMTITLLDNKVSFDRLLLKDGAGRFVYTSPISK